jgi:hypothetical protein
MNRGKDISSELVAQTSSGDFAIKVRCKKDRGILGWVYVADGRLLYRGMDTQSADVTSADLEQARERIGFRAHLPVSVEAVVADLADREILGAWCGEGRHRVTFGPGALVAPAWAAHGKKQSGTVDV